MILEIDKQCCKREFFEENKNILEQELIKIMSPIIDIDYVWKVVVSSDDNYEKIVSQIAKQLNTARNISQYGMAITMIGEKDKKIRQAIVMRESIYIGLVYPLIKEIDLKDKNINLQIITAFESFYHECGHLKEQIKSLNLGRNVILTKVKYDFRIDEEMNQYIDEESFSVWGEYYAQCFMYKTLKNGLPRQREDLENEILRYIDVLDKDDDLIDIKTERYEMAYDLLYRYVHYIAYFHILENKNKKLEKLESVKNKEIIYELNKIGRILRKTFVKYENEKIKLEQLEKICKKIYLNIARINDNKTKGILYWIRNIL